MTEHKWQKLWFLTARVNNNLLDLHVQCIENGLNIDVIHKQLVKVAISKVLTAYKNKQYKNLAF